jgi:hypothetical protein
MRTLLGLIAVAVLLLTPLGVHSVKAAMSYCDLAPENCFHGGDGRLYYLAPGSPWHKAYRAGKTTIPDMVERTRKQRECALHSANGFCRLGPPPGSSSPPGHRIPGSAATPIRAAWGCGATNGTVKGRSWNYPNRLAASYRALAACSRKSAQGGCRVVSCRPAVHTAYEAQAIWGTDAPQ